MGQDVSTKLSTNIIKPRKKRFVVDRDFQYRYMAAASLIGFVSTFLTALVILYPLYHFRILIVPKFLPTPFLILIGCAVICNIVVIAFFALMLTHSIAGPAFHLAKQFHLVGSGRWNAYLNVRQSDELHYLVRKFNQMIDGIILKSQQDIDQVKELTKFVESEEGQQKAKAIIYRMEKRLYRPLHKPMTTYHD